MEEILELFKKEIFCRLDVIEEKLDKLNKNKDKLIGPIRG
jgi:hypothetical protein